MATEPESMPVELQKATTRAITILRNGGIVAYPTDTVYGLGAAVNNDSAVKKIFEVKNRPTSQALPLLISGIDEIKEVAVRVSELAWQLAREFLPGGLTLVLFKSTKISRLISAGGKTVAVRVPAHPVPIALIKGIGVPIIGTSANLAGKPSPHTASDVKEQIGTKVDLIIDGGHVSGVESTIIDCTGEVPAILREGVITRRNIERLCEVC